MNHHATLAATLAAITLAGGASANAFFNGSFESTTGGLADGWQSAAAGYSISNDARTGNNALLFEAPTFNAAVALQNSVADGGQPDLTPGDVYDFSFWAKGTVGVSGNMFYNLKFLDSVGGIQSETGLQNIAGLINDTSYTEISLTGIIVPPTANAAFLEFSQGNGDVAATSVLIDDVSLAIVPEPGSLALLGLGGLALARRRRRA